MATNLYECMFLLDTSKMGGDVPGAAQALHSIMERHKAEVLASRPWEERRLAYPISGQKKGQYYLMYFKSDGKELINIERDLRLTETLLRHMVLKIDPKMEEIMLSVGRNPQAMALQSVQEVEGADMEGMGVGGGGDRRRRDDKD
jgi:small subunit ribosomal protein S6